MTNEDETDEADDAGVLRRVGRVARSAAGAAGGFIADRRFARTPAGKARAAASDGASTFHIRLDLDDIAYHADGRGTDDPEVDDTIGAIEAEGWALDSIDYVTETETWEEADDDGHVVRSGTRDHTFAVMLFRRVHDAGP